jgi:hypothetical protein
MNASDQAPLDDHAVDECIADYRTMHPEANEPDVRASVEFDTAHVGATPLPDKRL